MEPLALAAQLEASPLGLWARGSAVGYPLANLAHLLGLVMLIGGIGVLVTVPRQWLLEHVATDPRHASSKRSNGRFSNGPSKEKGGAQTDPHDAAVTAAA